MQTKIVFLILPLLLLFSINLEAKTKYKKGYIIETDGTKIEGYIKIQEKSKKFRYCTFKKEKTAIQLTFLPFEIQSYFVEGELFVAKKIPTNGYNKPVFVCVLTQGTMDHFAHENKAEDKAFYIGKSGEDLLMMIDASNYVEVMNGVDCDCDGPVDKLVSLTYKPAKITKWVKQYNEVCQSKK